MVILDIVLEVLGQISDACSDQGNLHFGGTRIALGTLKVGHDLRFLRGGYCHWFCSPEKSAAFYPLTGVLLNPHFAHNRVLPPQETALQRQDDDLAAALFTGR